MPEPKKVTNGEVCEEVIQEILELGVRVGVRSHSHGSQGVVRASMAATTAARAGLAAGCMARGLPFRPSCGCYQPLCWEQRAQLGCRTDSGPCEYGSPLDLLQNWNWCKVGWGQLGQCYQE